MLRENKTAGFEVYNTKELTITHLSSKNNTISGIIHAYRYKAIADEIKKKNQLNEQALFCSKAVF